MPEATFTISGNIKDFTRIDNLYNSLKREAGKMMEQWKIEVNVKYTETQSESESK